MCSRQLAAHGLSVGFGPNRAMVFVTTVDCRATRAPALTRILDKSSVSLTTFRRPPAILCPIGQGDVVRRCSPGRTLVTDRVYASGLPRLCPHDAQRQKGHFQHEMTWPHSTA